jgi:2-amino-4-hydroxy-6-hydroxymethyldihydropteridine diphosphokinase
VARGGLNRGYLGLGSNVGDRRAHLIDAVATLSARGIRVLASSWVYETHPVGLVLDQRDFLNACVRVESGYRPEELLAVCKETERQLGRAPGGVRHGPRVIDVDVLLLDQLEYESDKLMLPHPDLATREFVLVPLLELDPELTLPGSGRRLADALAALAPGQGVRRAGPPLTA